MVSMNERKTEVMVEKRLRKRGYEKTGTKIVVERQKSDVPRIQKLLNTASKRGGGVGKPEFLIHSTTHPGFVIVVECKADPKKHVSATLDKFADCAVDGALLYASYLSKDFDVLAIAVSGQDEASYTISHFFHLHGADKAIQFKEPKDILSFDDYYTAFINSDAKFRQDYNALLDFSRTLNNRLQAKKITESERAFLISGILISLQSKAFKDGYHSHKTGKQLATALLNAIRGEFESAELPEDRRDVLDLAFSFIGRSPALTGDKDFFIELIEGIDSNINNFRKTHQFYDIIGQFYVEFLKYANNDKGLGIVLTPPHVAELFSDLAEVNRNSIVFDNCCGTAGLLIAAMSAMIKDSGADAKVQKTIKNKHLFGIEFQPKIYALAVSNMILHGDGKTNIFRGDCFKDSKDIVGSKKPTVGVLNPPYKNKSMKDDREELEFVLNNLERLQQDGKCIAIVPITCATIPSGEIGQWKTTILKRHTLEAVMSMPIDLFHNSKTTVVTCVMVFTANRPHPKGKRSWFGYWRDDGFVKTKHRGRVDMRGVWPGIKTKWLDAYRNREVIKGFSVMQEINGASEWCAEAYLDIDYGTAVTQTALSEAAKRHVLNCAMIQHEDGPAVA